MVGFLGGVNGFLDVCFLVVVDYRGGLFVVGFEVFFESVGIVVGVLD